MTELMTTEYIVTNDSATICEVAADIGNARTVILVRTEQDPTPICVQMPSVRTLHGAFSFDLFSARGLSANSWRTLKSDEHVIERGGIERFLGRLAVEQSRAASSGRGSDARYYDGTTTDFVLAGVAAALPHARKIVISRLVTMLPIALWGLASLVETELRATHELRYNGRDVSVTVRSVQVKREGEAAFQALDGDLSGRVVVVDGGGRTVNVALFADGQFRAGTTLELGVDAALDNVDTVLRSQGVRPMTLAERDGLLVALLRGQPYSIHDGRTIPVTPIARVQFDATAHALVQELRAKVPIDQAHRIVLVGGAAHGAFFGDVVKRELPNCETSGLRELANAYGALGAVPVKKGKKK